jgi:hypothetical protein
VLLGLARQLPLVLVQVLPAPSDFPHELAALQSGLLHWLRPDTQTCVPVHCELQTNEFRSDAHAVTEHAPQDPPSVPVMAVQPPHAFSPGSLQAVLDLSVLHSYLPHWPHATPGAFASVPQPPQALALRPEHFTLVLSAVHCQSPQAPHEEFGALAKTPQPPQALSFGSEHDVVFRSALQT